MKKINWQVKLGIFLFLLSVFLYSIHFLIFRDAKHIFIYLLGDISFIPIEVLIVTLIIDNLITKREKREKMIKLNMVIGSFFTEVGTQLLRDFSSFDLNIDKIRKNLAITQEWGNQEYMRAIHQLGKYDYKIEINKESLTNLKVFLITKRRIFLRLLENPNLLEHERFTDLLWAVTHLTEELANRENLKTLSPQDYEHLSGDIKRAYILIISEWLNYMKHLKDKYPYIYSLFIRTNPFNENASAEIN